jgi:hypothetical protein
MHATNLDAQSYYYTYMDYTYSTLVIIIRLSGVLLHVHTVVQYVAYYNQHVL